MLSALAFIGKVFISFVAVILAIILVVLIGNNLVAVIGIACFVGMTYLTYDFLFGKEDGIF